MKTIKINLGILLTIFVLLACNTNANSPRPVKLNAVTYDFSTFQGKTVKYIQYCDGCGVSGDDLIIYFTDGTNLKVWAYKYDMEIYP